MSEYIPDKFVVIDYGEQYAEEQYAILAGWYGGFAGSDHWKRSSPIVKWEQEDDAKIVAHTLSGSQYVLYENCIGFTMLTQSLISQTTLKTLSGWKEIVKIAKGEENV